MSLKKAISTAVLLGIVFIPSGCSSIQLVSDYDESVDNQSQQLQKKLDGYFVSLQNASPAELKYKQQQKFYEGVLTDINSLEVRAGGIYNNKITIDQIKLLKDNFSYLLLMHKKCLDDFDKLPEKEKDNLNKLREDNGPDLSLDCNAQFGAVSDIVGRGEISLSRATVAPLQRIFNQHLGTIMALELAKKRGKN